MQQYIEPHIRTALTSIGVDADTPIHFEIPRQEGHGHLSTTVAMSLAKIRKSNPRALAQELVTAIGENVPLVERIDIAGPGFINITFAPAVYHAMLRDLSALGATIGRSDVGAGRTVNVEYVSANPTGQLHAGHGRNCAVGDTLANLFQWCGYHTTREYYFNNAGNQMNMLGKSIYARYRQVLGDEDYPFPEDGYHGDYPRTIAEEIRNEVGDRYREESAEALVFCRKRGEEWCFAAIKRTLDVLNIHHDVFFNEDSLYSSGRVEQTIADLRAKGLVYEKDGATWFALSQLGQQQDKVIVKSTGEPTYRLPDIAYHRDKLERGFDVIVDIFGADHIATIPDVLAGVQALGYDTSRVKVVIHQMVSFIENGEAVKFSKRSGKSFTLDDLIDEVGADVVRFFFIMRAVGTHLEFDLGLAKEEGDKNPVFYLQYAHARICSILRKAAEKGVAIDEGADVGVLVHPKEIELITLLSRMRTVVERACEHLEPHTLAEYLRDLAAAYHNFYHDCRILGSEPALESARLLLADVTRRAMYNGLMILGVKAPEVM
ncbi:MAG: arginine--tRNA ligase ['Candidatus Kapabacteria' thiocyanatum]|uniref:Arginine--tRNA ligase n=1 Tax=Candidatus Kapaibacterium thiocyanatum TaxID=1895771 RepID=A0A1M3KYB5_9BACT|nr:arginine--tRNA ligase ['Candidatus Kapabacteria' thiocyanatum]OJX57380.1 MAG: arginine--tRNA ligase ['Candidatus Kapabacteria' thiocyanatum]